MNQILKRLELIKTAISIDDEEIVELQIIKLKKIETDDVVTNILVKLENLDYGSAVLDIEDYLSRYRGVTLYEDKEVQGLKLELKALEKKLQSLSEQKNEYLNDIDEFNRLYHLKLGSLIQNILKLKQEILQKEIENRNKRYEEETSLHVETKDIISEVEKRVEELREFLKNIDKDDENYEEINQAYKELKENLKELEDELKKQEESIEKLEDEIKDKEYEEAKADYEEFSDEYEHIKQDSTDICTISEDEKIKLKKLFRKASRLCHPDIVVDELKAQAHKIMQMLNSAYSRKDLKKVKKILKNLKKGIAFDVASDKIDDKKILRAKIKELRAKIKNVDKEIVIIKQDDTFEIISQLDDWDEYFKDIKDTLEKEKERLREQSGDLLGDDKKNSKSNTVKNTIKQENSAYAKHIEAIEQPTFEKIRRYCSNLVDDDSADALHVELAKNGKMYKALIYDAMEQFLEDLEDESLTLIDWGCGQGLASALVIDYINEKELDIDIKKVILIEKDEKKLSRAMLHVDVLKEDEFDIKALYVKANTLLKESDIDKSTITLNLIANNHMPIDFADIDFKTLGRAYFVCLSNTDKNFINDIYKNLSTLLDIQNMSIRDDKIGRYERCEKIFRL